MPCIRYFLQKTFVIPKSQILLITNYREDSQYSMLRFGKLLLSKTSEFNSFQIEECFAKDVFGKLCKSRKFFKWAAYLDKYILFPKKLSSLLSKNQKRFGLVHIIDHSNSVYFSKLKNAPQIKKLVTCHDLIGIRTALNEFSEAPGTSASGKYLQRLIHNALSYADCYACDSTQSLRDLNRLLPSSKGLSDIIHLGTQCSLPIQNSNDTKNDLPFDLCTQPFLLHVGNSAWYKNRKAVLNAFRFLRNQTYGKDTKLILVGPNPQNSELDNTLSDWIRSNRNDIICLNNVTDLLLHQLYIHAEVLLFPSHIEGFGWPPLEAAIRGCLVITTQTGAIHDILGDYPIYVYPDDQSSIDRAVSQVFKTSDHKTEKIKVPSYNDCINSYYRVYERMLLK